MRTGGIAVLCSGDGQGILIPCVSLDYLFHFERGSHCFFPVWDNLRVDQTKIKSHIAEGTFFFLRFQCYDFNFSRGDMTCVG